MLARPTTDQVLDGIVASLTDDVLPAIDDEPARVAVQMIRQLARSAAVRAAHEVAWMHEEIDAVRAVATARTEPAVAEALAALDALDATSLHLADVQRRYDAAGEVLSRLAEAAFAGGTAEDRAAVRELLAARSAHEMAIVGQLDLVGRG